LNKIFFKVENNFGNGRTVGRKLEDNLFLLSFMNIIFYFIFDIFIYCLNTLNPGKSSGLQFFFPASCRWKLSVKWNHDWRGWLDCRNSLRNFMVTIANQLL